MQNNIGRLAWLAGGFPDSVAANALTQQCPSGMSAFEHAARAIMCGKGSKATCEIWNNATLFCEVKDKKT